MKVGILLQPVRFGFHFFRDGGFVNTNKISNGALQNLAILSLILTGSLLLWLEARNRNIMAAPDYDLAGMGGYTAATYLIGISRR